MAEYEVESLAWAAGFFDGEGYAGTVVPKGRAFPRFQLAVTQYELTTLERFQKAVGLGRIYSAAKPAPSGRVRSSWVAQNFEVAQATVAVLWNWLSPPKRAQIAKALRAFHAARRLAPRLRPRVVRPRDPNAYASCLGVGQRVATVTVHRPSPGAGRVGDDGEGVCVVCERVVSQRGGVAKRHRDKRTAGG